MEHFKRSAIAEVALILTNNPEAYVLQRADNFEIPSHDFDRQEFYHTDDVIRLLKNLQVDLIVLAGFLWLIPQSLLQAFPNKIINIHPSLLPKYPGLDTYQKALQAGDIEHGSTVHWVTDELDAGPIIAQAKLQISANETEQSLRTRTQQLEHQLYPSVINGIAKGIYTQSD